MDGSLNNVSVHWSKVGVHFLCVNYILTKSIKIDKIQTKVLKSYINKGVVFLNLKLIENEIIPIYEDDNNEKLVNARELHTKLESKQEFANWIKNRINLYEFLENEDYFTIDNFIKCEGSNLGNKIKDYHLTIDMAKELAMIEHNQKGRQIRKYFIEVVKMEQKEIFEKMAMK